MNKHKDKILGLAVSFIFIGLILWKLDIHQLITTFKVFNYKVLFLFVPLYTLSIYIRGVRWKYLLCGSDKLSQQEAFFSFTAGNTLNSYLPARAGDFWRAYHVGNKTGESKMKLLGSIILERIIDGISILMILFFAILTYFKHPKILHIAYFSGFLFFGALIFFYIIFKTDKIGTLFDKLGSIPLLGKFKEKLNRLSSLIQSFMSGFEVLNNPKCFWTAFTMSLAAWTLECIVTYILILGFGHYYGFSIAFFVISFVALSTVIPSSSVFVGPYQFAYIMALAIYHIDKSQALGIAFIHQMTIMIVITAISIIYFTNTDTTVKKLKQEIITIEENEHERNT